MDDNFQSPPPKVCAHDLQEGAAARRPYRMHLQLSPTMFSAPPEEQGTARGVTLQDARDVRHLSTIKNIP
nr:MAG TPA: hypothetical protein [Caudoviricetes sp.]